MKLKNKVILGISILFLVMTICLLIVFYRMTIKNFELLEEEIVIKNVERSVNSISFELKNIERINEDWAYWDDIYYYIQDLNEQYDQVNLRLESFRNINMNFFIMIDNDGKIIKTRSFDFENNLEYEFNEDIKESFIEQYIAGNNSDGFIILDGQPYLFSARNITTSDKLSPSRGTLVFGRYIDEGSMDLVEEITQLDVDFYMTDKDIPAEFKNALDHIENDREVKHSSLIGKAVYQVERDYSSDELSKAIKQITNDQKIYISALDEKTIAGYSILYDIKNKPSFILRTSSNREIIANGISGIKRLMIFLFLFMVLSFCVSVAFIQRTILYRLALMNTEIREISEGRLDISVKGNDELSDICMSINDMLFQLETSKKRIEEYASGLKRDKNNLVASNKELKEIDKMKGDFLNMMSHELKTPLTAIFAYLDILEDSKSRLKEDELKSLEALRRNSDSLKMLINNILEASRIDSGKFELVVQKMNLRDKIDKVVKNLDIIAKKKDIKLKTDLTDAPNEIYVDEMRFDEIMNNLLSNAIKFTEKGEIVVKAVKQGKFVLISVKDSGVGIPKDKIPQLFQNFYQVDSSISRRYGGTGLGLSISKKLIELHGGRIWVESSDKGSTFSFLLPAEKYYPLTLNEEKGKSLARKELDKFDRSSDIGNERRKRKK